MTFLFEEYLIVLEEEREDGIRNRGVILHTIPISKRPELVPWPEKIPDSTEPGCFTRLPKQVVPLLNKTELHKDAITVELKKLMYADDTILLNSSLQEAIDNTILHKKAARLGGMEIHPDKLVYLKLTSEENKQVEPENFYIEGNKIKKMEVEKYLGSRFKDVYDQGELNIKQRIAAARRKLRVQLSPIMGNYEMKVQLKIAFYISDVVPLLLHGIEYWKITDKMLAQLNKFQRDSILWILHRSYEDGITNVEMYLWLHKRGFKLYPMEMTVAERKIKYFSMIVREGIKHNNLAGKMFWSDFKCASKNWKDYEYEHIGDIKRALRILVISEEDANKQFQMKKEWEHTLRNTKQTIAFTQWCDNQQNIREHRHQLESRRIENEDKKEFHHW